MHSDYLQYLEEYESKLKKLLNLIESSNENIQKINETLLILKTTQHLKDEYLKISYYQNLQETIPLKRY